MDATALASVLKGYNAGTDPYEYLSRYTTSKVFPRLLPIAFPLLVCFGIWRIFIIIMCIGVIVTSFVFKKEIEQQHPTLWLYRKVYINGTTRMPYLVPNHLLVLTGSEIFSSMGFVVFTFTTYQSGRSNEFAKQACAPVWYGLIWLPACVGIWLAGWGYCYVCICSPESKRGYIRARVLQPIILNTICFGCMIAIASVFVYWAIRTVLDLRNLYKQFDKIVTVLKEHSRLWRKDPHYQAHWLLMRSEFHKLIERGEKVITTYQLASIWGLTIAAFLLMFYLAALFSLLRLMRRTLNGSDPEKSSRAPSAFDVPELAGKPRKTWSNLQLYRGYRNLVVHCILIATAQTLCCGVALTYRYGTTTHHGAKWNTAAPFVEMIPTTFITPILLARAWINIVNRHTTPVPHFSKISLPTLDHVIPHQIHPRLHHSSTQEDSNQSQQGHEEEVQDSWEKDV